MYVGKLMELAPAEQLYQRPLHPYTMSLLSAVPVPDPAVEATRERIILAGDAPSPVDPPPGCRFHTRCPFVQPTRCRDQEPLLRELTPGRWTACHWVEEIQSGQVTPTRPLADIRAGTSA